MKWSDDVVPLPTMPWEVRALVSRVKLPVLGQVFFFSDRVSEDKGCKCGSRTQRTVLEPWSGRGFVGWTPQKSKQKTQWEESEK